MGLHPRHTHCAALFFIAAQIQSMEARHHGLGLKNNLRGASGPLKMSLPPWLHFRHSSWPAVIVGNTGAVDNPSDNITQWYGQGGEDKYAYQTFFFGKRGGSYLELGALNGVRFSNTKTYHDNLDWRGLLIEGSPTDFQDLVTNRPGDLCVQSAICETPQRVHFVNDADPAVSGIWEFMAPGFKRRWHPRITDPSSLPEVGCEPLGSILNQFGIRHIDFFSLDVEGGELAVLRSIDWDTTTFSVIVVEADGHNESKNQSVRDLMVQKGYSFHGHVGNNDWFVVVDFQPSFSQ
jgi:hypothetical protein